MAIAHVTPRSSRAREQLGRAGQRPRIAVALVEQLAGAPIDCLSLGIGQRPAGGRPDLARQLPAVHPDQRLQLRARGRDAELVEDGRPGVDPSRHRVDQRSIEVEQDRVGCSQRRHRSYDTGPMPSELAHHWTLDPSVTFLNHGSFGATPRPVLAAQAEWRDRMEREPVAFFTRDLEPALDAVRVTLGGFVGADPDDLVLVPNATAGINTVASSLDLGPGDEILTADHAYNAASNVLDDAAARRVRAVRRRASLPRSDAGGGDRADARRGDATNPAGAGRPRHQRDLARAAGGPDRAALWRSAGSRR